MNEESLREPRKNTHGKYQLLAVRLTAAVLLLGALSGYFGWSQGATDLSVFSDNPLLAVIFFIGFVIVVNERIVEAFVTNFRARNRLEIESAIENAEDPISKSSAEMELLDYKTETARMTLCFSITIGGSLACFGILGPFQSLLSDSGLVNQFHISGIAAIDAFTSAWLVAGGSKGWNKFSGMLESFFENKTQANRANS